MLRPFTLAYWAFIGLTCPVFFAGAVLIWLVTVPFDRRRIVLHFYTCAWAVFYVRVNPLWKLRTTGRDRLPWRGPAVIVANHASLIDILVLFDLFRPFKWVSKQSNFKLPFIGWNMTLNGYVSLVRGDRDSVARMLEQCSVLIEQGNPVLFFAEGTRSRDGRLQPFKDGAFELAAKHGVPVIPVAVHGTGRALPKHGIILREHVDAHVEVLPPLTPGTSVSDLRERTRDRIGASLLEWSA